MTVSNDEIKDINSKELQQKTVDKRMFYDKLATVVVAGGGVAIILCIIAILFFIGIETIPLWQSPNAELQSNFQVEKTPAAGGQAGNILIIGTEEYTQIAFLFDDQGMASFVSLDDGSLISEEQVVNTAEQGVVTSTFASEKNEDYAAATSMGWVVPFSLKYNVTYGKDNNRQILPQILKSDPIKISDESISIFGYKTGEFGSSSVTAYVTANGSFIFHSIDVSEDEFMDQEESITNSIDLTDQIDVKTVSSHTDRQLY